MHAGWGAEPGRATRNDRTGARETEREPAVPTGRLNRSTLYYRAKGESAETLALMRRIDEVYLEYPLYGSRQMMRHLAREPCARRSESEPKRRSVLDPPKQCRRSVTEAAVNGEGVRGRGEIACG